MKTYLIIPQSNVTQFKKKINEWVFFLPDLRNIKDFVGDSAQQPHVEEFKKQQEIQKEKWFNSSEIQERYEKPKKLTSAAFHSRTVLSNEDVRSWVEFGLKRMSVIGRVCSSGELSVFSVSMFQIIACNIKISIRKYFQKTSRKRHDN